MQFSRGKRGRMGPRTVKQPPYLSDFPGCTSYLGKYCPLAPCPLPFSVARVENEKKEHQRATTGGYPRRSPWPTKNEGKREMEKGENVKLRTGPNAEKRKRKGREKVQCATTEASIAADQLQRASQPASQPLRRSSTAAGREGGGTILPWFKPPKPRGPRPAPAHPYGASGL